MNDYTKTTILYDKLVKHSQMAQLSLSYILLLARSCITYFVKAKLLQMTAIIANIWCQISIIHNVIILPIIMAYILLSVRYCFWFPIELKFCTYMHVIRQFNVNIQMISCSWKIAIKTPLYKDTALKLIYSIYATTYLKKPKDSSSISPALHYFLIALTVKSKRRNKLYNTPHCLFYNTNRKIWLSKDCANITNINKCF